MPKLVSNHTFEQVNAKLRDRIIRDGLSVGDRLPTVSKIAEEYEVSRPTVLRAVKDLVRQRILGSRRHHGIFVKNIPQRSPAKNSSILAIGSIHQSGLSQDEKLCIARCVPGWQLLETSIDDENRDDLQDYLDEFIRTHEYEVYLLSSVSEEVKRYFQSKRLKCVVAGGLEKGIDLPNVNTDEHARFYQGARYLIDCGFSQIAFLQFKHRAPGDYQRELGVIEAYNEQFTNNHIEKLPILEVDAGDEAGSKKAIADFLSRAKFPLGMLSSFDKASCWVLQIASQMGIEIPDQLGIVSEGSTEFPEHSNPRLTYIRFDHKKSGFATRKMLEEIIEGYNLNNRHVKIEFTSPYIIPGQTTPDIDAGTKADKADVMLSASK